MIVSTLEEAVESLAEATEDGEIQRQKGEKHRELLDTERKKLKKVEKEWRKAMEDFEFLQGKEAQVSRYVLSHALSEADLFSTCGVGVCHEKKTMPL